MKDHTIPMVAAKVCEDCSWERNGPETRARPRDQGQDICLQSFILTCLLAGLQPKEHN